MFSGKALHDFDPAEALIQRWRDQLSSHLVEDVIRNQACARRVTGLANGERNVEEYGFDPASVFARKCDEWAPVTSCEIGRVYVSKGPLQFDALPQEVTHSRENAGMDGLVGFVVGKLQTDGVARDGMRAEGLEVGRLARSGEADGEDDACLH